MYKKGARKYACKMLATTDRLAWHALHIKKFWTILENNTAEHTKKNEMLSKRQYGFINESSA